MKSRVFPFLLFVIVTSLLLSACGPAQATAWPGITVKDDTAYVAYQGQVFAVRTANGALQWKYPEKAEAAGLYAVPALGKDILVAGDYSNNLHAVNPATGMGLWKDTTSKTRFIAGALVTDKLVLAPSMDHFLYAMDLQGKPLWKFEAEQPLWSQPVSDGKTIFQGSIGHKIYAINPETGKEIWKADLGGAIVSTPLLDEKGILYVGTLTKEVLAVNSQDGKILWRVPVNEGIWGSPVIKDGTLFVGSMSGTIYALKAADGGEVWKADNGGTVTGGGALTSAGVVFMNKKDDDSGEVVMFDYAKGTKVWNYTGKYQLYGTPVSTQDQILVGVTHGDKLLLSLDLSGKETWSLALPK